MTQTLLLQEIEPKEMATKLPVRYIMFTDDVPFALSRIDKLTERLFIRGLRVVRPLQAFRVSWTNYAMLAFALEKL